MKGSHITDITDVGGTLFFGADDRTHGFELWRSDGTESGTVMVKDIWPGLHWSYPRSFTDVGGTLYFAAYDRRHGNELWRSDGTEAETVMVKDISPGKDDAWPHDLVDMRGTLFFSAAKGRYGRNEELWRTDGTEAGTVMVKDICPGVCSSWPWLLTDELWESDCTASGTRMVKHADYWAHNSHPSELVDVGDAFGTFAQMDAIARFALANAAAYAVNAVRSNRFGYAAPDFAPVPLPPSYPQHVDHVHVGFAPQMTGTPPGCPPLSPVAASRDVPDSTIGLILRSHPPLRRSALPT